MPKLLGRTSWPGFELRYLHFVCMSLWWFCHLVYPLKKIITSFNTPHTPPSLLRSLSLFMGVFAFLEGIITLRNILTVQCATNCTSSPASTTQKSWVLVRGFPTFFLFLWRQIHYNIITNHHGRPIVRRGCARLLCLKILVLCLKFR